MAILLRKSLFVHMAKTGGTWMTGLFKHAGVVEAQTGRHHVSWPDAVLELGDKRQGFAFVRHPASWWRSYWSYKRHKGWDAAHPIDTTCKSNDFRELMRRVLAHHPGYLSRRLQEMTSGVTWIGRFEALRDSLIRILRLAGEQV